MLLKIRKIPQWQIAAFGGILALVNIVRGIPLGMIAVAVANGLTLGRSTLLFLELTAVPYLALVTFLAWAITFRIQSLLGTQGLSS